MKRERSEGGKSEGKNIHIILKIDALVTKWLRFKDLSCRTRGGFGLDGGGSMRHDGVLGVGFVDEGFGGFALAAFGGRSGGSFLGFGGLGGG